MKELFLRRLGGVFGVLGGVLDLVGVGLILLGVTGTDTNRTPLVGGGVIICFLGVAFVLAGRLPATTAITPIEDPIEAMGRILDVRERGGRRQARDVTTTMASLTVSVECVDLMPYEAEFATELAASERDVVVAGARIPIFVDRVDPGRLERDRSRSIRPAR